MKTVVLCFCHQRDHLPEYDASSQNTPAEFASDANAPTDVGLHDQKDDSRPENDLQGIQDPIRLVTLPAAEGLNMLSRNLISDEHQGFGALELV